MIKNKITLTFIGNYGEERRRIPGKINRFVRNKEPYCGYKSFITIHLS